MASKLLSVLLFAAGCASGAGAMWYCQPPPPKTALVAVRCPFSQRRAIFDMTDLDHDGCEVVVRGLEMVVTEDGWSVTWACSQDARIRPDGE